MTSINVWTRKSTSSHRSYNSIANPKWNNRIAKFVDVVHGANSLILL